MAILKIDLIFQPHFDHLVFWVLLKLDAILILLDTVSDILTGGHGSALS